MAKGVGLILVRGDASSRIIQEFATRTEFKTTPTSVDDEALSIPLTAFYVNYATPTAGYVAINATVTFMYE